MSEFERLAGDLGARLERLLAVTLDRLRAEVPTLLAESAFGTEEILAFGRASLRSELRAFRRNALPQHSPEIDTEAARAVAGSDELRLLLNGYWAAEQSLAAAWLELVEEDAAPTARRALLERGDFFPAYARLLGDLAVASYEREFRRAARGPDARRLQAVRALLAGDSHPTASLDFELERHHLGLIAWGPDAAEATRSLASSLGRPLLLVGPSAGQWWGWVSSGRALAREEELLLERFRTPPKVGLALGLESFGLPGFQASHRQAQRARWAAGGAPGLHRYADVAVESLAAENEEDARAFVARELRGINDDSAISRRIRDTLVAYFAAEHNAASAGATLGVHQQTVANRLRAAEERLGHPIASRRIELELALRLRAALGRPGT